MLRFSLAVFLVLMIGLVGSACRDGDDPACLSAEFHCSSGQCIPLNDRCDGFSDCSDGSDEYACGGTCNPTYWYQCDNYLAIQWQLACDGQDDCGDNSDEDYCDVPGCGNDNDFECSNGVCWDSSFHCDGVDDCGDCSDETGC